MALTAFCCVHWGSHCVTRPDTKAPAWSSARGVKADAPSQDYTEQVVRLCSLPPAIQAFARCPDGDLNLLGVRATSVASKLLNRQLGQELTGKRQKVAPLAADCR